MNLTFEPGQSVTFRHRILVLSGTASPERIESEYQTFAKSVDAHGAAAPGAALRGRR